MLTAVDYLTAVYHSLAVSVRAHFMKIQFERNNFSK